MGARRLSPVLEAWRQIHRTRAATERHRWISFWPTSAAQLYPSLSAVSLAAAGLLRGGTLGENPTRRPISIGTCGRYASASSQPSFSRGSSARAVLWRTWNRPGTWRRRKMPYRPARSGDWRLTARRLYTTIHRCGCLVRWLALCPGTSGNEIVPPTGSPANGSHSDRPMSEAATAHAVRLQSSKRPTPLCTNSCCRAALASDVRSAATADVGHAVGRFVGTGRPRPPPCYRVGKRSRRTAA
jgi:hypothetical protein